ncbi:hypothetical protein [Phytohabitans kaempferiae]|uniref:Uncharacterized protein n=1 Tax=Phytohabitans kaempferiae TaxID=1620943 RepID=A0ABV6LZI5_9ACTN
MAQTLPARTRGRRAAVGSAAAALTFQRRIGESCVEEAFRTAWAAGPTAGLCVDTGVRVRTAGSGIRVRRAGGVRSPRHRVRGGLTGGRHT